MGRGVRAVVLLSGGLDSATALACALRDGFECSALTADYGQRHRAEIACSREIARRARIPHEVADLSALGRLAASALTRGDVAVPKDRPAIGAEGDVPATYVPARNAVLLSLALSWAESIGATTIVAGFNVLDASGYPDCTREFVAAFEAMARVGTKMRDAQVWAPLIRMSKAEIIRLGAGLGVDYAATHSCYDPERADPRVTPSSARICEWWACGRCDSCQLRRRGFADAGVPDPTRYA